MVKVLIVDDAPDIVVLLAAQLKGQGYEVLTANSGREALEIAAAERPDVMLLDVVMPGMDGFEVCRRLKADERLRMIQVIMVTAQDRDADVSRDWIRAPKTISRSLSATQSSPPGFARRFASSTLTMPLRG